jgi:hypothetical protein
VLITLLNCTTFKLNSLYDHLGLKLKEQLPKVFLALVSFSEQFSGLQIKRPTPDPGTFPLIHTVTAVAPHKLDIRVGLAAAKKPSLKT